MELDAQGGICEHSEPHPSFLPERAVEVDNQDSTRDPNLHGGQESEPKSYLSGPAFTYPGFYADGEISLNSHDRVEFGKTDGPNEEIAASLSPSLDIGVKADPPIAPVVGYSLDYGFDYTSLAGINPEITYELEQNAFYFSKQVLPPANAGTCASPEPIPVAKKSKAGPQTHVRPKFSIAIAIAWLSRRSVHVS